MHWKTKDIVVEPGKPGESPKVTFDGADVLVGAGIVVLILTAFIKDMRPWGWWLGAGLIAVWLVVTIILLFRTKPQT